MERTEKRICPFCGSCRNVQVIDYVDDRGNSQHEEHDPGCSCALAQAARAPIPVIPTCMTCQHRAAGDYCENQQVLEQISDFYEVGQLKIRDKENVCSHYELNPNCLISLVQVLPVTENPKQQKQKENRKEKVWDLKNGR